MIRYLLLCTVFLLGITTNLPALTPALPHIVFMIGEDEYHTWETLPDFAEKDLKSKGYQITIIQQDPADKNQFPGLIPALEHADLLFLSVRRRTPPKEQLDAVRAYLASGKPLVGIRTACHAFALRPNDKITDPKLAAWQDFDPEILGGHYVGHHGKDKVTVTAASGSASNPIMQGISVAKLIGNGGLYKVSPLATDTTPLLIGTIPDQPSEPIAWTRLQPGNHGRVFYSSLGHPDDFQNPEFRHFLLNAVVWALGK